MFLLYFFQNTIHGDYPCRDWRPVIAGMGVMGWQLAAILQTPAIVQSTFTTYTIKLIMIFQRRLIPSFDHYRSLQRAKMAAEAQSTSPYSSHSRKAQTGDVFRAKGQDTVSSGYYNETLKKYIYSSELLQNGLGPRHDAFAAAQRPSQQYQRHGYATLPRTRTQTACHTDPPRGAATLLRNGNRGKKSTDQT